MAKPELASSRRDFGLDCGIPDSSFPAEVAVGHNFLALQPQPGMVVGIVADIAVGMVADLHDTVVARIAAAPLGIVVARIVVPLGMAVADTGGG